MHHLRVSLAPMPDAFIASPSKDIKCLANQIRTHLKPLIDFVLSTESEDELQENEFTLHWISKPNEAPILITDNDQLEEIFNLHFLIRKDSPHFTVQARPADLAWAIGQMEIGKSQMQVR